MLTLGERIAYLVAKCQTAWWYAEFLEKQAKAEHGEAADWTLPCDPLPDTDAGSTISRSKDSIDRMKALIKASRERIGRHAARL